jgi:hypothetical protein
MVGQKSRGKNKNLLYKYHVTFIDARFINNSRT